MIVAVLDANVLASGVAGIARWESTPGEILRRWRADDFTLVVSEPILAELRRTLGNPYFRGRLSPAEIATSLEQLQTASLVEPVTGIVTGIATHPEDDVIIATALSAQAQYLVTGDKPLLERVAYRGTQLISPRQFLDVLDQESVE